MFCSFLVDLKRNFAKHIVRKWFTEMVAVQKGRIRVVSHVFFNETLLLFQDFTPFKPTIVSGSTPDLYQQHILHC